MTKQHATRRYTYVLASELKEMAVPDGGTVKLLGTGSDDFGWTTPEIAGDRVATAEIVAIPWGGNPSVQYYNGPFVTSDNRIAVVLDRAALETRFLYYVLLSRLDEIRSFYRGAGIQHPSMSNILDMMIPVPPVEVQREIVRVLDLFQSLEADSSASLEAELEKRRQQYVHYRKRILDSSRSESPARKLRDVADFRNAKAHEKLVDPDGEIKLMTSKFISTQGQSARRVRRNDVLSPAFQDETALVMSDLPNGRALARAFYVDADDTYAANQRVCLLGSKDRHELLPRFLFYVVDRNPQLLAYDSGVDQTHLKKDWILDIDIPIPPIQEQERVVSILDKFEVLVNDLSFGLPAEINARRQQYEYYRDKLLTFSEIGN